MTCKVKVELYDRSVVIPMPSKENETTKRANEATKRKVVIRNLGNDKYMVALFRSITARDTTETYSSKMEHVAFIAAEFLYGGL